MDFFSILTLVGGLAMFLYGMQYYEFLIRIEKEILTSSGNRSLPKHIQLILNILITVI